MIEASRLSQLTPSRSTDCFPSASQLAPPSSDGPLGLFFLLITGVVAVAIGLAKWYGRQVLRFSRKIYPSKREAVYALRGKCYTPHHAPVLRRLCQHGSTAYRFSELPSGSPAPQHVAD